MHQGLTLLHSANVEASRVFLALWGGTGGVLEGDAARDLAPAYPGCPCVIYEDAQGVRHQLFNPLNMAAVIEWQAAIDASYVPPLEQAKAAKQAELVAGLEAAVAQQGAEYGPTERATWPQQAAEAAALAVDPAAETPLLSMMATMRGITVADLAARVRRNQAAWLPLSGYVIGQRQALQDKLDAATTVEAVQAIIVTYSLPQGA